MDDAARPDQNPVPTNDAAPPADAAVPTEAPIPDAPAVEAAHEGGEAPLARRRLGRGLNALLGTNSGEKKAAAAVGEHGEMKIVSVEHIERNPFQPRKDFRPEAIAELAASIKQHGVLQPLLVRAHGPRFQLIAGERRLIASKEAGLTEVPVRVMDLVDQEVSEAALEENLKREDLNPLEKALAFQEYIQKFGTSIEEAGRKFGMSRGAVSNFLRLLELPEVVKKALRSDKISQGHARALLPLSEPDQVALCKRIQQEQLSVRATELAVKEIVGRDPNLLPFSDAEAPAKPQPAVSNHVLQMQQQLRDTLGLKVEIKVKGTNHEAGKVVIPFESNDEFERIVGWLRKAA